MNRNRSNLLASLLRVAGWAFLAGLLYGAAKNGLLNHVADEVRAFLRGEQRQIPHPTQPNKAPATQTPPLREPQGPPDPPIETVTNPWSD